MRSRLIISVDFCEVCGGASGRGSEPCVSVDAHGMFVVRAAARAQGEELGCHRGASAAIHVVGGRGAPGTGTKTGTGISLYTGWKSLHLNP